MENIKLKLNDFLEGYSKLIILGIGNDIRGDDGLGPYLINQISILKEDLLKISNSSELQLYFKNNLIYFSDYLTNCADFNVQNDININDLNLNFLENIILIDGGSVPENFTGLIKKENPSHIIIIDATLMNCNPGEIKIVSKERIKDLSVSTHSMSLAYLIKYLEMDNEFNILFIGIEPEIMDLSFELSDCVKNSCDSLIGDLTRVILDLNL